MVKRYRPVQLILVSKGIVAVKKNVSTPLYDQLAESLREQIVTGQLKAGQQLPSERDLSEQYEMSRMTVRQGLAQLEHEGLVTVKSGVGTFVAEPKLTYDAINVFGFTEAMLDKKGVLSSRVLSQRVCEASVQVRRALALIGQREVIEIKRVRLIDSIPMAIETNYLSAERFAGLETMNLKKSSLYTILEDLYNVRLHIAEQTIEASTANPFEQKHLGIAKGVSTFLIEGTSFDQQHRPVEFFKSSFRGDRFKVSVVSQRHSKKIAQTSLSLVLD
jgi:GntR family transcriptional regulator